MIIIHILLNIARSKCNQTMKFGQLVEYGMSVVQIFCLETSPNSFSKKSKFSIFCIMCLKYYTV